MYDIVLQIIAYSMKSDVYIILCFLKMSLTRADLFPDLIVLTSPHGRSAYPIADIFEVTLKATKPRPLVDGKDYF